MSYGHRNNISTAIRVNLKLKPRFKDIMIYLELFYVLANIYYK